MEIRRLTPDYAVSPQIAPEDVAVLRDAGFVAIICNRPDAEVGPDEDSAAIGAAAQAAGLAFHVNPVVNGGLSEDGIAVQREICDTAGGPVFAYCRSGTRSTVVWALAKAVDTPAEALVQAAADQGYDLSPMRAQFEARHRAD